MLVGIDEVDQVVRMPALLGGSYLSGADVEVAIDLCRIAGENFSGKLLGEMNGKSRLAGGRGPMITTNGKGSFIRVKSQ